MILLSMVMERLEKQSAQMERLEAKVDELAQKVGRIEQNLMPGCGLPAKPKDTKPTRPFVDYIRVPAKDKILAQLHRWIDGRQRVKAILYIKAAVEARVLEKPPFVAADAEFPGRLGSKSLYYVYTGEPMAYNDEEDLEELRRAKAALERLLARAGNDEKDSRQ